MFLRYLELLGEINKKISRYFEKNQVFLETHFGDFS